MESRYYHGLAGDIPFYEEQEVLDESLTTLNTIFALGGIYCRNSLDKYEITYYNHKARFNDYDYISICIDNPTTDEFTGDNLELDSSFYRYVRPKIAIEFKPTIVEKCTFRKEPYRHLPGERQIYKFIDISNVYRILVGLVDLQDEAIYKLTKICKPYNIPVMTFRKAELLDKKQKLLLKTLFNKIRI